MSLKTLLIFLVISAVKAQSAFFPLNILHYNDFHAHFDEIAQRGGPCNPEEVCIGGLSRLSTAIKQVMVTEPDSLLLNAGDTFQGTIWYNFLRWNVSQHFMNLLPHDAHVLGNHEFDSGVDGLVPYLERLKAPMLGANVNTTFEPKLTPYVNNSVVVQRNGRKIGIIGILLRQFSASTGRVIMEDELEAVNREAALLTEQGINIIIVLSHVGYTADMDLAARMSPDVDVIVGGHSHSLLYNGPTPDNSTAAGKYPTIVTQATGHRILIVQASAYTRYLGNLKVFFNENGNVVSWQGQPIYLGPSIVKDPYMESQLEPWRREVDARSKEVLGRALAPLRRDCFHGECNVASWLCDVLVDEVVGRAEAGAWGAAHACLMNAGAARADINDGNITTEALLMAFPFENNVQLFDLKGEFLLQALEFSVAQVQTNATNFISFRLLQVGGLRVVYNATAPAGARVVSARVRCIRCAVPRYEPLDRNATYRLVTQSFIGDGGDGFTVISQNRENVVTLDRDYELMQRHLRRRRVALQDLDGRIQIVY